MSQAALRFDTKEIKHLVRVINGASLDAPQRRQLLRDLGMEMEDQTVERFDTKIGPDGERWADIAEATKAWYEAEGWTGAEPPLVLQGELRDTVEGSSQVDSWKVLVGATKVYAAVHQFGWEDRNIAARPYIGIGDQNAQDLADIATRFIDRQFGKGAA